MASEIEVHQIPVISTSHLTREVAEQLTRERDKNPWCTCAAWEHGYFLYLDELPEGAPKCLEDICQWLKKHSFTACWVRLDCDGAPQEDLPTYDW